MHFLVHTIYRSGLIALEYSIMWTKVCLYLCWGPALLLLFLLLLSLLLSLLHPPSTSMLLLRQMNILTNILTRVSLMHMLEILYNSSLQVKLLGSRSCPPKIFLSSNLLVPVTLPATAHKMVHSGFCFYWLLLLFFIVSISLFNAPFIILFVLPFGAHFFYST